MLTNSYGPEYGQASGAIISIATRSGTNSFHGSAFYEGRNDALAAYTYFAARNAGKGQPLNGKDKLRRNDWGYSIGGPIKKDKLFFFFNQEWNHEIRGFTQSACVATAAERAGDFSQAVGTLNGQAVMDCNEPQPTFPTSIAAAGNSHALATVDPAGALLGAVLHSSEPGADQPWREQLVTIAADLPEVSSGEHTGRLQPHQAQCPDGPVYPRTPGPIPPITETSNWGDTVFPVINGNWAQPSKMAIGRVTTTISDSLVNDAEFAYSNNRINITSGGTDPGLLTQLSTAIPSLYGQGLKHAAAGTPTVWGGLGNYGSNNTIWSIAPWNNTLDIYTIRDDVSKVAGRHAIKFGLFLGYDGKNEDTGPASSERPKPWPRGWCSQQRCNARSSGNQDRERSC